MKISYSLYGIAEPELYAAKILIEQILNIEFVEHESLYLGIYYGHKSDDTGKITLRTNSDPFDPEPAELDFPDHPTLLYLDETKQPCVFSDALKHNPNISLLRHETFQTD